ncbi:MAG: (Fe-S)-binding protein [Chloroflexi bacterium]|nr:(Fe-S)-binding protein [Chloroflexota bacterium]
METKEQHHNPPESMTTPQFRGLLDRCIHCGLCLQNCPTYVVMGTEADSPRGRIQLMRAVSDRRIPMDGAFRKHLDLCLSCLSCQSACPSGVQYGKLIDTVHLELAQAHKPGLIERGVRWLGLRQFMPHLSRLRLAAKLFRLYQMVGLQKLVRAINLLPKNLKAMEAILPPLPARHIDYAIAAPAIGEKRGTVLFFYGCLQDAFLGDVNKATIHVLQRNGFEVHFPQAQTCCGAAQVHTGELDLARDLARKNIDAFLAPSPFQGEGWGEGDVPSSSQRDYSPRSEAGRGGRGEDYVAIINNAGGCGAMLKEYAHLLADDPTYAEKAQRFVEKVQDVSEFLAKNLCVPPKGEIRSRVTYSDSCHLRNAQKIVKQPRDLIKAIPGLEYIEMQSPDRCCGSAGVYNIVEVDTANQVLDTRMQDIAATRADTIVVTNTGCHLQLIYGVRKAKLNARVVHLVELLEESYQAERRDA